MIILFHLYFKIVFRSHQCRCETNLTLEENFMWTKSKNERNVYEYQKLKYLIMIKVLKIFCILFLSRNTTFQMTNLTSIALITTSYLRLFISDSRVYKKNVFLNSSSFRHVFLFFFWGGVTTIWRKQIEVFITMNYKDIY